MQKQNPKPANTTGTPKAIKLTHEDVHMEIVFLDTPPKSDIKKSIVDILSSEYQEKRLA